MEDQVMKRWTHDGPRQSSQRWHWHWRNYQGKAYPNPIPGEAERDQSALDQEIWARVCAHEDSLKRDQREFDRNMLRRRREKTGRIGQPLRKPSYGLADLERERRTLDKLGL